MNAKKRVLHLLSSHSFSGAENVVCQIVDMFRECDQLEMLYCSPDGPIRESLAERNVNYVPLKSMSIVSLYEVLRQTKPDIIHAHDMKASFFASLVCGKIALISHIHNNNFDSRKLTIKALLYSIAAGKARHIFWVSDSAYKSFYFQSRFASKSTVLYNIVDVEKVRDKANEASDHSKYDVVFVGRMSYPKNPIRIINVLDKAISMMPQLQAVIIGNGDLEKEVHAVIQERKLEKHIHCLGFMSNPHGILSNSKVMLMTSRWEGTPMCALEAMAHGVPIVSTPTDGLCELVEHGVNGYLSDEDEQLSKYIVDVISNELLWKRLSFEQKKKADILNDVATYRGKLMTQYGE